MMPQFSPATVEAMARAAFPRCRVLHSEPLAEGRRNANFKLCLDEPAVAVVLRVYLHEASLCPKEIDLLRLLRGSVPVPEVLYAETRALEGRPPFAVLRYVEGLTFLTLKRTGDRAAIAQAARSVGETLASIGEVRFSKPGWIEPGPSVGAPLLEGADPYPRFIEQCLARATSVPADLRHRITALAWSHASDYAAIERDPRLVHGDFSRRNLVVHPVGGTWQVAAVIDWEFAVSSSPLADIGNFLRYDSAAGRLAEPHFSAGYRHGGGILPDDWRRLAQLFDLAAICESLTRPHLPDAAGRELLAMLAAF